MTKYVKLIGNQIISLPESEEVNYLDEEKLNTDGFKEFVPATYEQGKPYEWSYEETATQIIEHVTEIIPDPADLLKAAKKAKHNENDEKAEIARENHFFTLTIQEKECSFQTTRKTQQDLETAKSFIELTGRPYQWFSDNNEEVYLTLEDVVTISTTFMGLANVYPTWSSYETRIDLASTVEEVNAIVINYNNVIINEPEIVDNNEENNSEIEPMGNEEE